MPLSPRDSVRHNSTDMVFYVECFGLMPFKIRSPELGEVNLHSRKIGICHGAGIPPGIIQAHKVEDKKKI